MDTAAYFQGKKPNGQKLAAFGCSEQNGTFFLRRPIADGTMTLEITVAPDACVHTRVTDVETGDEYVLYLVDDAAGEFVGTVRAEVEKNLRAVAENCFDPVLPFYGECTADVLRYARETYGDQPEFLWKRTPDNFILRRKDNGKWYAAFLPIPKNKLGDFSAEKVTVLDLRMRPEEGAALLDGKRFFPGYHMNKKHWLSVPLDGTVPLSEILRRLDDSYTLAKK